MAINLHFQFLTVSLLELSPPALRSVRTCLKNDFMFVMAYLLLIDGKRNWFVVLGHVARSDVNYFRIQRERLLMGNYRTQRDIRLPISYKP